MGATNEIILDPQKIEEHYDLIINCSNNFTSTSISEDEYTNLSVKSDVSAAHDYAGNLEKKLQECIKIDTANLKNLGITFIEKDSNISEKINEMTFE